MDRSHTVSALAGLGAAVVVALVGPFYGGLVVICAMPLAFLTLSRAATGTTIDPIWPWLLITFGVSWLALLPVAPFIQGSITNVPKNSSSIWAVSAAIGVLPIVVAAAVVALTRYRASRAA